MATVRESSRSNGNDLKALEETASDIVERWKVLIFEYEALRDALREHVQEPHWPGVEPFIAMIKSEAATAERLLDRIRADADDSDHTNDTKNIQPISAAEAGPRLAASNVAAKETLWRAIKKCRGLLAIERRVSKKETEPERNKDKKKKKKKKQINAMESINSPDTVYINAVVDDGYEWLRLVSTTEQRLLMEMTEAGWEFGEGLEGEENENIDVEVSLTQTVKDLMLASRNNRYKGANPRICLVLNRVERGGGRFADIDVLLTCIEKKIQTWNAVFQQDEKGPVTVVIHCANSAFCRADPPSLETALVQLMPKQTNTLSPTLNIDTSILIALASDISHRVVAPEPWHTHQRAGEIEKESQQPGAFLRQVMQDMGSGRELVCTREAAQAFGIMVEQMGQESEKRRARALVGEESSNTEKPEREAEGETNTVDLFRRESSYADAIPDNLRLPIRILDQDWDLARIDRAVDEGQLPAAARSVAAEMAPAGTPTMAVFFYGWASGHTTYTTNHTARNRILRLLEDYRTSNTEAGPTVAVCRTVRSLNGKKKEGQ